MRLHIIITYEDNSQEIFELIYISSYQCDLPNDNNNNNSDELESLYYDSSTVENDDNLDEIEFLKDMFLIMKTPEKLDTLSVARFYLDGTVGMLKSGPFNEGKWWFNTEYNKDNEMVLKYKTMLNKWLESKDSNKPYGKSLKV